MRVLFLAFLVASGAAATCFVGPATTDLAAAEAGCEGVGCFVAGSADSGYAERSACDGEAVPSFRRRLVSADAAPEYRCACARREPATWKERIEAAA